MYICDFAVACRGCHHSWPWLSITAPAHCFVWLCIAQPYKAVC
ncbi:unnamed protein product, partial [Staurois parvus]